MDCHRLDGSSLRAQTSVARMVSDLRERMEAGRGPVANSDTGNRGNTGTEGSRCKRTLGYGVPVASETSFLDPPIHGNVRTHNTCTGNRGARSPGPHGRSGPREVPWGNPQKDIRFFLKHRIWLPHMLVVDLKNTIGFIFFVVSV